MEAIRRFPHESYRAALGAWSWVSPELTSMAPAFTNAFGDVFLQAPDGSFAFLDTLEGTLEQVWSDANEIQSAINTPEVQDRYLLVGLLTAASAAGLRAGPSEVLSFKVPPALGGEIAVENLEVSDFVVALDLAGQILGNIRSLPPGTPITGLNLG